MEKKKLKHDKEIKRVIIEPSDDNERTIVKIISDSDGMADIEELEVKNIFLMFTPDDNPPKHIVLAFGDDEFELADSIGLSIAKRFDRAQLQQILGSIIAKLSVMELTKILPLDE